MRRIHWQAAIALIVALQLFGCGDEGGVALGNQPPTVWLSSAPPEGSVSKYTIHLYWGGWDPDGEVAFYEYVVANNATGVFDPADTTSTPGDYKWHRVNAHDSTFTFTADLIPDSSVVDFEGSHKPEEFRRSHTFFVRSVDREGVRSVKPAYRSFTARTLSPTVYVEVPIPSGLNPAEVPAVTSFHWTAKDFVTSVTEIQEPDSVRWIIAPTANFNDDWDQTLEYIRENPDAKEWSDWRYYGAPGDSGKFWTTSPPLAVGRYYFAIQAKDEAGAVSPVFDLDWNLRRIAVGPRVTGPLLRLTNLYIGLVQTASPDTPPVIIDLPSGVPMVFEFWGDASSYGGVVAGYRYGWDIVDLNDDDQWEVDFTPFVGERAKSPSRTFFFGTHSFFLELLDNSGYKSRVEVRVNVVPFSMERDLLLVDDWREGNTCFSASPNNGRVPCDAEHDAFWNFVLESATGFNPNTDVFELGVAGKTSLPIQVLAKYKNVIWNAIGNPTGDGGSFLDQLITFRDPNAPAAGKVTPNLVALYMAAGGHVLLAGNQIMTLVLNRAVTAGVTVYPIIFRYELDGDQDGSYTGDNQVGIKGVGEESFGYGDCCVNVLDATYLSNPANLRRTNVNNQRCPVELIRERSPVRDGLRTAIPHDLTTGGGFPQLELRPETADSGKAFSTAGLTVDLYNPIYFSNLTACGTPSGGVAEIDPSSPSLRHCFQAIYGNGCQNTSSVLYDAAVGFWTTTHAHRVADVAGAVAARSAVWGFSPVYFNPDQVKAALQIILHDEWKIPRG
jgi:hypothetical protein